MGMGILTGILLGHLGFRISDFGFRIDERNVIDFIIWLTVIDEFSLTRNAHLVTRNTHPATRKSDQQPVPSLPSEACKAKEGDQ